MCCGTGPELKKHFLSLRKKNSSGKQFTVTFTITFH